MRYLVIGLGIYGSNLARDLAMAGHEVIAVDRNHSQVEAIKDFVSTVYIADTTEQTAIDILPLDNIELAIVAIGENFGASVKTVALLRKAGMRRIFARAIDTLHEAILRGLEVERILTPEQRAAFDLVHEMSLDVSVETLAIDKDYTIIKFPVPDMLTGLTYAELDFEKTYGLHIITVTRPYTETNILGIKQCSPRLLDLSSGEVKVEQGDVVTVWGSKKAFMSFYRSGMR